MRYAGLRSDFHEFLCDLCGRHVLIHSNPSGAREGERRFVVMKQGDFWASHCGGIGGLTMNGVEVQPDHGVDQGEEQDDLSDEWKGWLDDIFDDAE